MRGTDSRGAGRLRAAAGAVVAVLVGLGVVACDGEPAPRPSTVGPTGVGPEASPTGVTPSASQEPEPVASPAAPDLSEVGPETAAALAVYFVQLYPYVYATGDLTAWTALSHPECVFCASVVSGVEDQVAVGHHTVGAEMTLTSDPEVVEIGSGRSYSVTMTAQQEAMRVIDSEGRVVSSAERGSVVQVQVLILRENEKWLVRGVGDPGGEK